MYNMNIIGAQVNLMTLYFNYYILKFNQNNIIYLPPNKNVIINKLFIFIREFS